MNKKTEVSKGLRSLLTNIEKTNNPDERKQLVKELNHSIALISPAVIEVNPFQPRTDFDEEKLLELAKSIKTSGLIQPITVRALGGDTYQLISGERRLRASKMAGLKEIPAYIRVANDQEMLEMALVENIQRSDLNALEVAISYQRLMDECNLTHEALSDRVGKDRSTITNYIRLLKLPVQLQSAVRDGLLSMGHARALAGIENPAVQLMIFKQTIEKSLSVRATEQLIRELSEKPATKTNKQSKAPSESIQKITAQLSQKFGTKVSVNRNQDGKGSISLPFRNDDEFNKILELMEVD
ncbi:MAG: ParB/RepB/Spo0J family partition protein [Lewinellaceae bacterium]|nr:ParB/RepB/Spo0J family partition protein [Lewinellaceae bacterium]